MERVIPLLLVRPGYMSVIKKIGGMDEMKKRLETMGLVIGSSVTVFSEFEGNLIIGVKDSRLGISMETAGRIMVCEGRPCAEIASK
ncbi:MAG: ferrous iron transport protein A [Spirochaetia bacterium]|jgi:ferrous iron transport protein A|nr:ferrous iron transport protein A [Spirochaetia bacterium]